MNSQETPNTRTFHIEKERMKNSYGNNHSLKQEESIVRLINCGQFHTRNSPYPLPFSGMKHFDLIRTVLNTGMFVRIREELD